jgi:site-specific recombinase XerD
VPRQGLGDEVDVGQKAQLPECVSVTTTRSTPSGPMVLRHAFGTQLVRAGVALFTVAELMGHSRLETSRLYTG